MWETRRPRKDLNLPEDLNCPRLEQCVPGGAAPFPGRLRAQAAAACAERSNLLLDRVQLLDPRRRDTPLTFVELALVTNLLIKGLTNQLFHFALML